MHITLSTVTPVYRGEKYLESLAGELARLRDRWESTDAPIRLQQAIFVDDGSVDDSAAVLERLSRQYDWLSVLTLSRNVGQHSATVAGICHTSSDWVVTLDEDLQHRPEDIERLLMTAVSAGADVCYASPRRPVHGNSWRDRASVWTKSLLSRLADSPYIKDFNSFRLIRGEIARAAARASSSQTYLDIAIAWHTNSVVSVLLEMEDERFSVGKSSGYALGDLIRHARRLLVSSSLDIASRGLAVGLIALVFAGLTAGVVVVQKLFFPGSIDTAGWASLVAISSFFGGVIIALLCIALEYLHVLVLNQLGKPTFFVIDRHSDEALHSWLCREDGNG